MQTLWTATSPTPRFDPLRGSIDIDVAIIGAGITGLTAALLLQERGLRVAVIEKDTVAAGESGNTTAHLTVAIDARYHYIRRKYSKEEARLVADASRASLEKIAEIVERHSIDCHFRRVPGYLYTEYRKYVADLKSEAAAAREAGIDAQWITEVPLPFETRGAVLFPNQAQFHPGEYLDALAKIVANNGGRIFEHTLVTDVEEGKITTESGVVNAREIFMATNVPVAGFTQVHLKTAPYRTYAMAFEVTGDHPDGLFWDTADPYHYTRWQETDAGTFLIVGGEDHRTGEKNVEKEDTVGSFASLLAYAREYYRVRAPRYQWSGQVIEPHGGLPLIGGSNHIYLSTGYAGQGMTFGTLGAMMVADFITNADNPWKDVFNYTRTVPNMTAREFITENLQFPKHLAADRLTSRDVEGDDVDDVLAGEAKILSIDGKKVAAYRDEGGALHCVSPICTHMKCDVAWNGAERTWDCPCHGSRFTPEGEVLNGPAREPLERVDLEDAGKDARPDHR